jgi:RNA polymerase sigma-70 factor (ECF subfamily)
MTDGQLAVLSQRGNREAFGVLVGRWNGRLFRFLVRILGDEEAARDTCQEALLRAWAKIGRLREPEHFKTWLHSIALNLCRDRGRSGVVREVALDDADVGDRVALADGTVLREAERRDVGLLLETVLARLPIEQRTAIVLRELEGFTSAEIGTMTGVPAATVRSRIFYGLKALRRMLPDRDEIRTGGGIES